jgi:hypothetical protein
MQNFTFGGMKWCLISTTFSSNTTSPYSKALSKRITIKIKHMGTYVHDLSMYQTSFVYVKWFMSCLHIKNVNFNFQLPAMFMFSVSRKSGLITSCLSFEYVSVYTISWFHIDWCKFCTWLRSSNIPLSPNPEPPLKKLMIQITL